MYDLLGMAATNLYRIDWFQQERCVGNVPPERFQNHDTANGTQGGAVLFAPPSKSCRFSHPPSTCARKHGHGDFAVCGRRLRGHVPSKNTSPAALSWSSLIGESFSKTFCFYTMLFVFAFFAFPQKKERTQDPLLHSSCFPALTARRPPDLPPPHRDWGYVWSVPD